MADTTKNEQNFQFLAADDPLYAPLQDYILNNYFNKKLDQNYNLNNGVKDKEKQKKTKKILMLDFIMLNSNQLLIKWIMKNLMITITNT